MQTYSLLMEDGRWRLIMAANHLIAINYADKTGKVLQWHEANVIPPEAVVEKIYNGERNVFFQPENCDFEIFGFYEEFMDVEMNKWLGIRFLQGMPSRKLGADGQIQYNLTESLVLKKGPNEILVKASARKPIKVSAMLQVLCGQTKVNKHE